MVDRVWRIVVGVGAVLALVTLLFQLTIPESPRFLLDVRGNVDTAFREVTAHESSQPVILRASISLMMSEMQAADTIDSVSDTYSLPQTRDADRDRLGSFQHLKKYILNEGNWRYLAGTGGVWFALNFGIPRPRYRQSQHFCSPLASKSTLEQPAGSTANLQLRLPTNSFDIVRCRIGSHDKLG